MTQLAERVAIVTGGGRGIGRAIARRFAMEGACVVIAARTSEELVSVVRDIEEHDGKAVAVTADVSREEDVARILRMAEEVYGGADILVNNAGIYGPVAPIEEIAPADWDRVLAV